MSTLTLAELGAIMLGAFTREQLESGYAHDCTDETEVGRSALLWGDIERDGTLT